MDSIDDEALMLEAFSDKVLHQLSPTVWKELFLAEGRRSIQFEQRQLTLVYADAELAPGQDGAAWERFRQELQRLSAKHHGRLDPYVKATALVTFENPAAAVRMGMALLRAADGLGLRVGVVSGRCTLAFFRAQGRLWCTPLGVQTERAAHVAASAPLGGIVISPETYGPTEEAFADSEAPSGFHDSEMDLTSLAQASTEAVRRFIH